MITPRLKISSHDSADWRYQVLGGNGDVLAERRFLPDRASAQRIGEHERLRIAADLARTATAARWRGPPVLKQDEIVEETIPARSWVTVFFGGTRYRKPWKNLNADRSIRPLRAR